MWDELTDENLEPLRRPELGLNQNFNVAVDEIQLARDIALRFFDNQRYAPRIALERVNAGIQSFMAERTEIAQFDQSNPNAQSTHDAIEKRIRDAADEIRQYGIPYAGVPDPDAIGRRIDSLDAAIRRAEAAADNAETAANAAQSSGTEATAIVVSGDYCKQAKGHRTKSWIGGITSIILIGLLVGIPFAPALGDASQVDTNQPGAWLAVLIAVGPRIFLAALLLFALRFTTKYFTVNSHLQVLAESKRNALDTFPRIEGLMATKESREAALTEVVHALFADPATGYVPEGSESISSVGVPGMVTVTTGAKDS